MAKITYPNQRLVRVHRERATSDFLGIKNENWQAASRTLGAHALRLYLYIASNANNYTLALSPAAIERDIGMARSTYHDQFHKLINYGYIIPSGGTSYEFYETPQPRTADNNKNELSEDGLHFEEATDVNINKPSDANTNSLHTIEINKTNSINNTETNISVPKVKVKEIVISPPEATGSKRPQYVAKEKKEFIF